MKLKLGLAPSSAQGAPRACTCAGRLFYADARRSIARKAATVGVAQALGLLRQLDELPVDKRIEG